MVGDIKTLVDKGEGEAVNIVKLPLNEVGVINNPLEADIFDWEEFPVPHNYTPISLKPGELKFILTEYSQTTTPITNICRQHGTNICTMLSIINTYPELQEAYTHCKASRATLCNDKAMQYYTDKPPEWAYDKTPDSIQAILQQENNQELREETTDSQANTGSYGETEREKGYTYKLSSPAVSWIRDRSNALKHQAARLAPHTYGDVQRIESKSLTLSAHMEIPTESRALVDAIEGFLND